MNINGIIVGAATFLIIGICHPLVIKAEYYIGKKSWCAWRKGGLTRRSPTISTSAYIL